MSGKRSSIAKGNTHTKLKGRQGTHRDVCHSLAQRATAHTANLVSPMILNLSLSMSMSERSPKPTERKDKILCVGNRSSENFTSPQQLHFSIQNCISNHHIVKFLAPNMKEREENGETKINRITTDRTKNQESREQIKETQVIEEDD